MNTPVLEGFGIRLEPVSKNHMLAMQEIATDPDIWRFMPRQVRTPDEARTWVFEAVRQDGDDANQIWTICLNSGNVIGSSRLFELNWQHRTGEIGFTWLTAPYRRQRCEPPRQAAAVDPCL